MEKITNKRIIVKTIEEEIEMISYQTTDGMIFDTEDEALKYDENLNFLTYFNDKYKLKIINPVEYGLNYDQCVYCHLVYIKKLNDENIDDFVKFYELKDYPNDILKLVTGWSFIAMINDVDLWLFGKTERNFIVQSLNDTITIKRNELKLLENIDKYTI